MHQVISRIGILSTGSEILQGQYADTNARYIAEKLTLGGFSVVAIMAAPDDPALIEDALRYLTERADLVITTGGLGPTQDDVNRFVFEQLFEAPLVRDEKAVDQMARRFVSRGLGPMPEANEVQAMLPQGCTTFYNRWGTAPGFYLPPTGKGLGASCALMALPGPPSEMVPMFEQLAMPLLGELQGSGRAGIIRTIHTYGHPESGVGTLVKDLFEPHDDVEFTILAKRHGVDLRIRAFGENTARAQQLVDKFEANVRERLSPEMIYGVDDETLAHAVGQLLKTGGKWVTTAESCTGGLVSTMLTDIAGSSAYISECHVTYSNAAKERILGVKHETLETYGAVSEETAREMAEGARRVSGADYAISITGVAGPDGGTPEKPVGLVYIGIAAPGGTEVRKEQFNGNREHNRLQSAQVALNALRLRLIADAQA